MQASGTKSTRSRSGTKKASKAKTPPKPSLSTKQIVARARGTTHSGRLKKPSETLVHGFARHEIDRIVRIVGLHGLTHASLTLGKPRDILQEVVDAERKRLQGVLKSAKILLR